jgi:hypothetical protein
MANDTFLNTPVLWINKYLQHKVPQDVGIGIPFFPSIPSSIDALTEEWVTIVPDASNPDSVNRYAYAGVMSTWDRMFRMNRSKFPHIKSEQVLYYFYATQEDAVELMIQTQECVNRLLDRLDESAAEVNNWCMNRKINLGTEENPNLIDNMFYFHSFKVYQLEEVRDIIDFGTARTYAGNKIIIDYQYHQMTELTNNAWQPEAKLSDLDKIII